jgi:REP element-mobilizing transposase RayT
MRVAQYEVLGWRSKKATRPGRDDRKRFERKRFVFSEDKHNGERECCMICPFMRRDSLMGHTFSSLNVHCIFSTKERIPILSPEVRERLWPYLGGIAKQNGVMPACVVGVADHAHLLLSIPTTMAIARAIQFIKAGSSATRYLSGTPNAKLPRRVHCVSKET